MIGEVNKALDAYGKLDAQGKKLFRGELGLVRPQQATKRTRKASQKGGKAIRIDPNETGKIETVRRKRTTIVTQDGGQASYTTPA